MLAHALVGQDAQLLVEQFRATITGTLDAAAFRQVWELVFERHGMLRAAPAWERLKKPVQVVRRNVELPWHEVDLREVPDHQRRDHVDSLVTASRNRGFDLARPPLMRFDLVRLANDEWLFVWTCHHLVVDGWCLGIALREVFSRYEQICQGLPVAFAPCGTFGDYLKWLAGQDAAAADEFWARELAGLGPPARLPLERPACEGSSIAAGYGECELRLSPDETARLAQLAAGHRVSQSALVKAAWAILLARYLEREDVVFGVTVSGRPPEVPLVETIVGPLANNIPLRVRVPLADTLAELFARLSRQQLEAQPFEYCPLARIASAAGRTHGRLFDALVVYENYPLHDVHRLELSEITIHDMHGTTTSSYPLSLIALPGRELTLRMLFDYRLYGMQAARDLLAQTAVLLRAIAQKPEARVRDLPLVAPESVNVLCKCRGDTGDLAMHVLDSAGRQAPVGMPGDLWISSNAAGQPRNTGYRACVCPDGTIEYLGPGRSASERGDVSPAGARRIVRIGRFSVDAAEITAILRLHPLVAGVAIASYADREGTIQLAAYVVPSMQGRVAVESVEPGLVLTDVRRFLAERVPAPMNPAVWRVVDELPLNESGGVDVAALPPAIRPRGASLAPYVAPRAAIEERVARIWSVVLGVEPVGVSDGFLELGGYSSLAVTLLARIEEEFGRRLPLAALFSEPTVAHMARLLSAAPSPVTNDSLVPLRVSGSAAPLFCVHPAGGTVFCYLELAHRLSADVPVYGLQAQGIDGALVPQESIEAMATSYIGAMKSVQADGPYRICGWSTGGYLAFEIARQLLDAEDQVSFVGLIDAAIPRAEEQFDENDLAPMLEMIFPDEDGQRIRQLRDQPLAEQVDYFRQRAERARLVIAGAGAKHAQAIYSVFEANMRAAMAYSPRPLSARLTLFRATEQATPMHADQLLGWGPWAAAGAEVLVIAGTHLTMLQPPAVERLAALLDACLGGDFCDNRSIEDCCAGS
jgi:thioesterase domain-containing protein